MPLLGFILSYGPVRKYCPHQHGLQDPPKGSIKVLSYNVWFYAGWEDRSKPNPILEYIKQQNADIVCLQESAENERFGSVQVDSILGKVYPYKDTAKHGGDFMTIFSASILSFRKSISVIESKSNMSCAFKLQHQARDGHRHQQSPGDDRISLRMRKSGSSS
jgi:mRNA deadenylase 3'-5' endonuclease subunit Ccr4